MPDLSRAGFVLGCARAVDRSAAVPVDVSSASITIELTSQARGDGGGSGSGGRDVGRSERG